MFIPGLGSTSRQFSCEGSASHNVQLGYSAHDVKMSCHKKATQPSPEGRHSKHTPLSRSPENLPFFFLKKKMTESAPDAIYGHEGEIQLRIATGGSGQSGLLEALALAFIE